MIHHPKAHKTMSRWKPLRKVSAPDIRLGDTLRKLNLISEADLAESMLVVQQTGDRLGRVLISRGHMTYYDLYQGVAEFHHLPFINLLTEHPTASLLNADDIDDYLNIGVIPWREENGRIIIAACDISHEVMGWVTPRYGNRAKLVITSPLDIRRTVEHHFGHAIEYSSRLSLWEKWPHASARFTLMPRQEKIFYTSLGVICACIMLYPIKAALAFIIFCHIAYSLTMLFKLLVFSQGARSLPHSNWDAKLATISNRHLPIYTVLIPMYKEASSLPGMLKAMENLDYPASKLDIKLLLEMDDEETFHAAQALNPRYQFEILRVPPGNPRTKPRACNYALRFARGEFVTIFDAEDRPEPQQLKKAVYTFRNTPDDVACLQAPLNYYNANDNWLTRFFSLEYTILFQFMLRDLERLRVPIPLGGTSNHIALDRIRASGQWDPYNVTEDADLGTRLAAQGFRTIILDSYTMEESPNRTGAWIKQRSRWIKGYMQTWIVHMRHPLTLYNTLGARSFTGFQFFIGLPSIIFLSAPLVWALSLFWMAALLPMPGIVMRLMAANLGFNLCAQWLFALWSTRLYNKHRGMMCFSALLYPFYLILHSIASYKALWQLVFKPHFWEKTTHGVAHQMDAQAEEKRLLTSMA